MDSRTLRMELRRAAKAYAGKREFPIDDSHDSAIIFLNIKDNFHESSFENIKRNQDWIGRIQKPHQNIPSTLEMQSSNSSDALLMNIFCHPDIQEWKGVAKLLEARIEDMCFGYRAEVCKEGEEPERTEIDMAIPDAFVEAKLTETDFTRKKNLVVEQYLNLQTHFHVDSLERTGDSYENYQVIRNLLASIQHERKHILLCDERRPDLARRYMQTVMCLKGVSHRKNCRIIFWQELVGACGGSLRRWIEEKYGMNQGPSS